MTKTKIWIIISLCLLLSINIILITYHNADLAENSRNNILTETTVRSADGVLFEQDFNDEIPANYNDDGLWRIPEGWEATNYISHPDHPHTYLVTQEGDPNRQMTTTHLVIKDYQSGMTTYGERSLSAVFSGSFEFNYYMTTYFDYTFLNELFLESSSGDHLITLTASCPTSSLSWGLSLEGKDSELEFAREDCIHVKIDFDGTSANLIINGTEVLSDISYTSGIIENLRLTTGPTGGSSWSGQGHYDNLVLKYTGDVNYLPEDAGGSENLDDIGGFEFLNDRGALILIIILCFLSGGLIAFILINRRSVKNSITGSKSEMISGKEIYPQNESAYNIISNNPSNYHQLPDRIKYCANCGTRISIPGKFCSECGHLVE